MIYYHVVTYITPQAFIEEDDFLPIIPVPQLAFEDDSWQRLIAKTRQTARRSYGGIFNSALNTPLAPAPILSVDEEIWQHCISSDLRWRTSLWF